MSMTTDINTFIIISVLTGLFVCGSISLLGTVVVWRKLAYIGEAISHSSLLGIILAIMFSINITLALMVFSCFFAFILFLSNRIRMGNLLTLILSYSLLSVGMVLLSFFTYMNLDIMSFLFGDILLVNQEDLMLSATMFCITIVWLLYRWKNLIYMSLNEELAKIDGVEVKQLNVEFLLLVSVVIGLSIKIIGALMVTAMLIIPAVTAGNISYSPFSMLLRSLLFSMLSVIGGVVASIIWDSITGPSIVVCSSIIFLIVVGFRKKEA